MDVERLKARANELAEDETKRLLERAMSAEMAISPANARLSSPLKSAGNDKTSVVLFFSRNRKFNARIASLLVSRMFTRPESPTARRARSVKRSSDFALNPATFFSRMIKPATSSPLP